MKRATVFALITSSLLSQVSGAQRDERTLMHTFQDGSRLIHVTIVDRAPAPVGLVTSENRRKERWFTVSRSQFDDMWATLASARVEKYAKITGKKQADRSYDAVNYYVFAAEHGWQKIYAVPSSKAPGSLVSLARQFRGYAK